MKGWLRVKSWVKEKLWRMRARILFTFVMALSFAACWWWDLIRRLAGVYEFQYECIGPEM